MKNFTPLAITASLSFFLGLLGCSSGPQAPDNDHPPAWTQQSTRTVDGGYIVYVGTGEDRKPEKAQFKAEAMALQDLANECSFDPKGARVEDRFDQEVGVLHRAYAKVAVEFQLCENARQAVTPDQIRTLANAQMAEEVKQYQSLYDQPEPSETPGPLLASNAPVGGSSSGEVYVNASPGSGVGAPPPPVYIGSTPQYFVVSQQVAYEKQTVVLAPPAQYPPQAPISSRPITTIVPAQQAVDRYAVANPSLRTTGSQAFSTSRPNWTAHQADALRQPIAQRSAAGARSYGSSYGSQRGSNGGRGQGGQGRRRRRRDW